MTAKFNTGRPELRLELKTSERCCCASKLFQIIYSLLNEMEYFDCQYSVLRLVQMPYVHLLSIFKRQDGDCRGHSL